MRYYTIAVADDAYKGSEPLTYQHEAELAIGQIVLVQIRRFLVSGMVVSQTKKPTFTTKSIAVVFNLPPLPPAFQEILPWIMHYYAAPLGVAAQQCIPGSLTEKSVAAHVLSTSSLPTPRPDAVPPLITEQVQLLSKLNTRGSNLIHGDTGTGKTRLYIEQALTAIAANKSVVVLTPEISLTSQLVHSFKQVFGNRVLLTHSNLTTAQRRKIWLTILKSAEPLIIVGPRSALFAPLGSIGLIVIDEAHDDAYKQEGVPSYHALRVASKLASLHGAQLLLGSATPSVSEYHMATARNVPILRLTTRPTLTNQKPTEHILVDMRERANFTQNHALSNQLIRAIKAAQSRGEQSLLFLNRRGTSRITLCKACGWRALCDHCATPLTFHGDFFTLRCHTCTRQMKVPSACPDCSSTDIIFKSEGTKAIEALTRTLFPSSNIMRFDTDNKKSERLEQQYEKVKSGDVDILIGTQLLAKGLDLPKLSVVGVLNADLSLHIPDFTAEEKTYQLLAQVMGRVGRGHRAGTAVVQTYNPDNKAIKDSLLGNWQDFYEREIVERKAFLFPPFCHLMTISVRRKTARSAEQSAQKLFTVLQGTAGVRVEGPLQSYHERIEGDYEWRIIIKSKTRTILLDIIKNLPSGWRYDIDPTNLL